MVRLLPFVENNVTTNSLVLTTLCFYHWCWARFLQVVPKANASRLSQIPPTSFPGELYLSLELLGRTILMKSCLARGFWRKGIEGWRRKDGKEDERRNYRSWRVVTKRRIYQRKSLRVERVALEIIEFQKQLNKQE